MVFGIEPCTQSCEILMNHASIRCDCFDREREFGRNSQCIRIERQPGLSVCQIKTSVTGGIIFFSDQIQI